MRYSKGGYYTKRHSCFLLQYHMVLVTKFRNPFLTGDVKDYVYDIIRDSLKSRGSNLIDMDGEADHIHILFEAPPDEKLTELANVLKTRIARLTWSRYADKMRKFYWNGKHLFWSNSYFVTSVGYNSKDVVSNYIKNQ